jgi:TetR/AcrR family transcriptional regulator, ethionamide resistance regulator
MAVRQGQSSADELRRAREGNADTRIQIFAATEELLERVPLHDLSVAQIIDQAEISRATFYAYFSSKFDVVVGLLTNVLDDVYDVARLFIERPDDEPPDQALRRALDATTRVWRTHRFALRAATEHWHSVPELRAMWLGMVARFTDGIAGEIDRQRAAGIAPPGTDSRELTAVLLWATERSLYVAGLDAGSPLPSEQRSVPALYAVWRGAIYGADAEIASR